MQYIARILVAASAAQHMHCLHLLVYDSSQRIVKGKDDARLIQR